MHDERTPAEADKQADADVLELLIEEQLPLSMRELALQHGDPARAEDAVARLHAHGLVHRAGEFVFATRAARRAELLHR